MTEWDTRALHREACDAVQAAISKADRGRKLLDAITGIGECLRKMDDLKDITVNSCNDSRWDPNVYFHDTTVRAFVRKTLEARREELRAQFNALK